MNQLVAASIGETFELPPLPYALDALEPFISLENVDLLYNGYHTAYVTGLNGSLGNALLPNGCSLAKLPGRSSSLGIGLRTNLAGHDNLSLFYKTLRSWSNERPVGIFDEVIQPTSKRTKTSWLITWPSNGRTLTSVKLKTCTNIRCEHIYYIQKTIIMAQSYWLFGAHLIILTDEQQTNSRYDLIEGRLAAGAQTPLHRHTKYAEAIHILKREFTVYTDSGKVTLTVGDYAYIPINTPHVALASGDRASSALTVSSPSGFAKLIR